MKCIEVNCKIFCYPSSEFILSNVTNPCRKNESNSKYFKTYRNRNHAFLCFSVLFSVIEKYLKKNFIVVEGIKITIF